METLKDANSADLLILGLEGPVDEDDVIDAAANKYFTLKTYFLNQYPVVKVGQKRVEKLISVMRAKFSLLNKAVPSIDDARPEIDLPTDPKSFFEAYESLLMKHRLPVANTEDEQLIEACLNVLAVQQAYHVSFDRMIDGIQGLTEDVEKLKMSEQIPPNELLAEIRSFENDGGELIKLSRERLRVKDLLSL